MKRCFSVFLALFFAFASGMLVSWHFFGRQESSVVTQSYYISQDYETYVVSTCHVFLASELSIPISLGILSDYGFPPRSRIKNITLITASNERPKMAVWFEGSFNPGEPDVVIEFYDVEHIHTSVRPDMRLAVH